MRMSSRGSASRTCLLGWDANGPLPGCTVLQVILYHKLADAQKGFQPGNCFYQIRQPPLTLPTPPLPPLPSCRYSTTRSCLLFFLLSLAEFYCVMYLTISHNFFVRAAFPFLFAKHKLLSSSLLLIVCDAILMFAFLFRRFFFLPFFLYYLLSPNLSLLPSSSSHFFPL